MGLRAQAAADARAALADTDAFAMAITVTDPSGATASLTGLTTDIALSIDPETGVPVSGRRASVAIALKHLSDTGMGIPVGIANASSRPWVVAIDDVEGSTYTFKVIESNPDRAMGIVLLNLEAYRAG